MTKRKHDKIEGGNTFFDSLKRKKNFSKIACFAILDLKMTV